MRKVITIAREFGAGGGEIGRRVAKELGIQFYDKDIILRTALANPKLDPEDVRRWDERVPSPLDLRRVCLTSTISRWMNGCGRRSGMRSVRWQTMRAV